MTDFFRDDVLALVVSSPGYEEELFDLLYPACLAALTHRLKDGVDPRSHCPEAFTLALARMISDQLEGQGDLEGVTSITAGCVSVHRSADGAAGREKQALSLLRPWLKDESFSFRGVAG